MGALLPQYASVEQLQLCAAGRISHDGRAGQLRHQRVPGDARNPGRAGYARVQP